MGLGPARSWSSPACASRRAARRCARSTIKRRRARSRVSTMARLVLQVKAGQPEIRIPLTQIVEIMLHPVAGKPQMVAPRPAAARPSNSPWSAIGNLLGITSPREIPESRTPDPFGDDSATEPSDQPPTNDDDESPADPSQPAGATNAPPADAAVAIETPAASSAPSVPVLPPLPAGAPATTAPATGSAVIAQPARGAVAAPPSRHPGLPSWRIELAGGDHFLAAINGWDGKTVKLALDAVPSSDPAASALEVPDDRIRAIWSADAALVKQAQELKPDAAGQDVAFVEKDGQVKSVAGVVLGIDGEHLKFKFDGEERKIKLQRLRRPDAGPARDDAKQIPLSSLPVDQRRRAFRPSRGDRARGPAHRAARLRPPPRRPAPAPPGAAPPGACAARRSAACDTNSARPTGDDRIQERPAHLARRSPTRRRRASPLFRSAHALSRSTRA